MNIWQFVQSLIDTSKERIKTPITGSYTLAFIIYNWQAISIFLFSKSTIEKRIEDITNNHSGIDKVLWPLAIAILYNLLIQYIMYCFDFATNWASKERHKVQSKQLSQKLDGLIETESKKFELKKIASGVKENEELKIVIENLNQEKSGLLTQIEANTDLISSLKEDIDELKRNWDIAIANRVNLEKRTNVLLDALSMSHLMEEFNHSELDSFVNYVDFYIYRKISSSSINVDTEQKFVDYMLIDMVDEKPQLTSLGELVYKYWKAK